MVWQPEIDELKRRQEFAAQMGGERGIAEQRRRGKLTVRERIDALADPGSFREFAGLVGKAEYDDDHELAGFTPKGGVDGFCTLDGRRVVLNAGDFTVRGGSGSAESGGHRRRTRFGGHIINIHRSTWIEWRRPTGRSTD